MDLRGSDASGTLIPNLAEAAQATVRHAEYGSRRLDLTLEEAARIGELAMKDPVVVTVRGPLGEGGETPEPKQYFLTEAAFAKICTRASVEVVMNEAKMALDAPAPRPTAAAVPKVDYTAPDKYGTMHKGRVTEAEAALVRANLEQANANRKAAGQEPIDPADPTMRKRYGFDTLEAAQQEPSEPAPAGDAADASAS